MLAPGDSDLPHLPGLDVKVEISKDPSTHPLNKGSLKLTISSDFGASGGGTMYRNEWPGLI